MPNFIDYDMTAVRTVYAHLKERRDNARDDRCHHEARDARHDNTYDVAYARGHAAGRKHAYEYAIECFLEIFGLTLEE